MPANYPNQNVKATFPQSGTTGGILLLTVARTPVNALNDALWKEIADSCTVASSDPDVAVVILASGIEKVFTAGLDLTQSSLTRMQSSDAARTALLIKSHIHELQDHVSALEACSKPIIAAIHGIAFGGALDIVAACDVRYAATNSLFSIKEVDVGLAADVGSLQRLPIKTGNDSLLRELAFTGRNFDSAEALTLGLVSKVVEGGRKEVLDAAMELAKVVASKSPVAVVGTKHLLNYSQDHTVQEGLNYTAAWNMSMLQAQDLPDAFAAFATKKPAVFKKLGKL